MMRFLFAAIALSSVVVATELVELSANAQNLTEIYIVRPDNSPSDLELEIFGNSARQNLELSQFTEKLNFIEQATPTEEDQNLGQSTNTEQDNDPLDGLGQVSPTEEDQNLGLSTNTEQDNDSLADLEQEVHNQVNQYRASIGLPPLSLDSSISEQARIHSQNMARGAVAFSHDGFSQRVQAIATVLPESAAAENVGYNTGYASPATQAVEVWLNSTEHRTHISGNYNLTGIGVALNASGEYEFTQIFLSSP